MHVAMCSSLQVEEQLVTDFNYVAGVTAVLTNQLKEVSVVV